MIDKLHQHKAKVNFILKHTRNWEYTQVDQCWWLEKRKPPADPRTGKELLLLMVNYLLYSEQTIHLF
jgi:hypothetical protein